MNLLEKTGILNIYPKNKKKSIHISHRIDIFFILALLVLIISPLLINLFLKLETEIKQINLFLSPRFEELFGKEAAETILLEFGKQNPDLRIRLIDTADEKSADILIFDEGEYRAFAAAGALAELNSYINSKTPDGFETGGKQLALPLVSFMDLLFYNIELLTAAGLDRPPKTREEFLAYARAVSGGNDALPENAAALSLSPQDRQAMTRDVFSWMWASGIDFLPEEQAPVINTRAVSSVLSFLGALYNEGLLAREIFDTTGNQRLEEFARGKIAMMIASTRAIPYLREKMGDDAFGITAVPLSGVSSALVGKYGIGLSNIYAGIYAESEYPDEAWSFLEFLAGQSLLFSEALKAVPGVIWEINSCDYVRDDPFYSKAYDIFESSAIVQGFSGNPGAEEYENAFLEELKTFFTSNRTPQDTMNAIQRRWDEIGGAQ
jgi:multiple sugar transport system substrate-binding protein